MLKHCLALSIAAVLVGCQASGEQYQADVFDASQVNTQQEAKTVKIITVCKYHYCWQTYGFLQ